MCELDDLKELVVKFRDKRDWEKFHTPKNLSISISIEASELMELFQWHNDLSNVEKEELEDEIADVFIYLLLMADATDVDIVEAVKRKVEKNKEKYPI
ncbi:MAG: nucleotide pyrophosphohydrolase [Thermoplasmatota archaeon]